MTDPGTARHTATAGEGAQAEHLDVGGRWSVWPAYLARVGGDDDLLVTLLAYYSSLHTGGRLD